MKTDPSCPCAFSLALPDGLVGIEEQRWQRVENWLLDHLADVQDRAFIIMRLDLATYEEMMRRYATEFLGSLPEVLGSSPEVLGSSPEVLGSSKERPKRGLAPKHRKGPHGLSWPPGAWVGRRVVATPQGPGHAFQGRTPFPAPASSRESRRAVGLLGQRVAAAPRARGCMQRFHRRAG